MALAKSKQSAKEISTVGKRKAAIARIILEKGTGKIAVNGREFLNYFGRETLRYTIMQPFEATGTAGKFDAKVNVFGGGQAAQADALKHGLARALLVVDPEHRKALRSAGLLTRDARIVERKKYGRRKARRRSQYSKR